MAENLSKFPIAKSPVRQYRAFHLFDAWQFPTLAWGDPTLPSALRRFTSEFGMGSGGTTALLPPGKFCFIHTAHPLSGLHYEPISEHYAEKSRSRTESI